jgi:signal transduction histidine kinase
MLLGSAASFGQSRAIDSLKKLITSSRNEKDKIEFVYTLSNQPINADTLYPYIISAETWAEKINDPFEKQRIAFAKATYYVRKNNIDSALLITNRLIDEFRNDKVHADFYLSALFLKAKILDRANLYTQSLTELYKVEQLAELRHDTATMIQAKTGLGWVQMEMEQYHEALNWLNKALHTSTDKKFYKGYGALYSNLASTYNSLGNPDSAHYYINVAIKDARESDNLMFLATALSMQAKIFINNKQQALAEAPLHEALLIRRQLNDPFYTVYDMSSLASYYANTGQTDKGIALCKEGIALAKANGLSSQLLMIYRSLGENYKAGGNDKAYGEILESIIHLKDSFNNINSSKLLADMQAAGDAQKKQKEILEQKLNLKIKNYWLFGSAIFGCMLIALAMLAFKYYRRREKQKMEIALVTEKAKAAVAVQKAEEKERVRIAADLHDNLGVYAASLSSNLSYIKLAERDPLSDTAYLELKNNSNAIISELNDTIWVLKKEALSFTAISDRLKVFINRIQKSYPDISIEVKENIERDFLLSSAHAFHLYRTIQEAVNNALKHSRAKTVTVCFEGSANNHSITVTDNGEGMPASFATGEGGNGLQNMRQRSSEAGYNIEWNKGEDVGTVVRISSTTN